VTDFRTALDRLTEGRTPPTDLADRALVGLGRRRRRNLVRTAATAALLVVAVAIPVALFRPGPAGPSGGGGQSKPGRYVILSYDAFTDETDSPGRAWDPETHRYVKTGYTLVPSPDGVWAQILDYERNRWAVARWADAVHHRNVMWRLVGDPVEEPGGPGYSTNGDGAFVQWAADGATLLEIAPLTRSITYLDPATMRGPTVRWPARIPSRQKVISYGTYGDLVTFRIAAQHDSYVVYSVNRKGAITRTATVQRESVLVPARWDRVSPDGRYLQIAAGVVLDTTTGRSTVFGGADTRNGFTGQYVIGWYDDRRLIQVSPGEQPGQPHIDVTMTIYDATGHRVKSLPLPGFGPGRTNVHLGPPGADTDGAVQVTS
jgi:hypothetical protein